MRVGVHAGQLLQPIPGGIGRYTNALLARLAQAGVDPLAFGAGTRPSTLAAEVPWLDLGWPHGSVRYELWHRFGRPRVRIGIDLVHAPSLVIPPVAGVPLVVTVHDVAFLRMPRVTTPRGERFHTRALELVRRHADLVLAPSEFTRRELLCEGFAPERVEVAYLGTDEPYPRADAEIDATVAGVGVHSPFVLTVGTLEPRKDLPTIIEAVDGVRRVHPDLSLVVVGPPGWGAVELTPRKGLQVLGEQPWPIVDALYRRATAFCVASRYEGFGLPALEALARGAPVVASSGSAIEEVVGDAGLLFPVGDTAALADQLSRVIENPALRRELRERGLVRSELFHWGPSVDAHLRAYQRAVSHFGRARARGQRTRRRRASHP